ncbi:MAG: hypothetical protein ACR2NP_21075 [Pirellulaceae bacterium]
MTLSDKQLNILMQIVEGTTPDSIDCDGCFGRIAEFVELELAHKSIPDAMEVVRNHLNNCPCCQDEFNSLLDALANKQEPA